MDPVSNAAVAVLKAKGINARPEDVIRFAKALVSTLGLCPSCSAKALPSGACPSCR